VTGDAHCEMFAYITFYKLQITICALSMAPATMRTLRAGMPAEVQTGDTKMTPTLKNAKMRVREGSAVAPLSGVRKVRAPEGRVPGNAWAP